MTCPVVLARGGRSDAFGSTQVEAVMRRLPKARREDHPELGHLGPLEDPRAVATAIRQLLDEGT